jgi:hypothetical protein
MHLGTSDIGSSAGFQCPSGKGLIVLTLLPIAASVPLSADGLCFEVFGFDVLIDRLGKPWQGGAG